MCELFVSNSKSPQALAAPLKTFFGDSVMHPHGWGLATRDATGAVRLAKAPGRAIDSLECTRSLDGASAATHVLAHIRYATKGTPSRDNCHPFAAVDASGTEWAFMHNGSVFHPGLIESFTAQAKGESDSELVFLYLLDALDRAGAGARSLEGRLTTIADALAPLSYGNKLNVVLDDGIYTYVHTNTEDDTLFARSGVDSVLLCTRSLDGGAWQAVPKRRVLAYRDGRLVAATSAQGGLYRLDEDELDAFLLANAA